MTYGVCSNTREHSRTLLPVTGMFSLDDAQAEPDEDGHDCKDEVGWQLVSLNRYKLWAALLYNAAVVFLLKQDPS